MIQGFDELNKLPSGQKSKNRSIPYKEYFRIMKLSNKQKKERIDFAERLEDDMILIMLLFEEFRRYNITDDNFIVQELQRAYMDAAAASEIPSDDVYISEIALIFALNFVQTTLQHADDEWYTSSDRLKYNAENEANTVLNYKDYLDAKGKYKYKVWHTENDTRVRMTHIPLEGERIPIDDLFVVGDALMRYPKDYEYAADYPEELVNCRCSIEYSN